MFTTLEAARSLDEATVGDIWIGLLFTAVLLIVIAVIAREVFGWHRAERSEATVGRLEPPKAA